MKLWKLEDARWWLISVVIWGVGGTFNLLVGEWQDAWYAFIAFALSMSCWLYNVQLNAANEKLAEYEEKNDEAA